MPGLALGVSRSNIKNKTKCRLVDHHSVLWQGLTSTQRYAFELILFFNRMQSRVIGLLTGHNTMRKYLYILDLMASPWYKSCRPEQETSAHISWECEALATLSHTYLGCSLMDPEDVLNLSLGATGTLLKGQDSHDLDFSLQEYKGPVKSPHASEPNRLFCSIIFYHFAHWIRKARKH